MMCSSIRTRTLLFRPYPPEHMDNSNNPDTHFGKKEKIMLETTSEYKLGEFSTGNKEI